MDGETGRSGFWVLTDPEQHFDRIIICRWSRREAYIHREVFTALPGGLERVTEGKYAGRYNIRLIELKLAGTTDAEWESFVDTEHHDKTRPVYVNRPATC
jgi:hypothetical protein